MLLVIDDAELAIVAAAVRIGLVLDSELVLLAAARVGFLEAAKLAEFLFLLD